MQRHNKHAPTMYENFIRLAGFKNPDCKPDKFGRKCCKICAEPIPKGSRRRVYCSERCSEEYTFSYPMTPRDLVYLRDKGVCCHCGIDTEEQIKYHMLCGDVPAYRTLELSNRIRQYGIWHHKTSWVYARIDAVAYLLEQLGASRNRYDLWDMDHIIGVELYTGDPDMLNDLDNLRTLCIPCHREVTARQAKERAKRKKNAKKIGPKERQLRQMRQ